MMCRFLYRLIFMPVLSYKKASEKKIVSMKIGRVMPVKMKK